MALHVVGEIVCWVYLQLWVLVVGKHLLVW